MGASAPVFKDVKMHKWMYHKTKTAKLFNPVEAQVLQETLEWFDNPELELNDYQKKFSGLMDEKKQIDKDKASEHDNKNSKRRSKKSV